MEGTTKASAEQIEHQLEEILDQELFEPPADFREKALIQDESIYEEAGRDPEAWWAKQSEELLDWAEPWDTVLDESEAHRRAQQRDVTPLWQRSPCGGCPCPH